MLGVAKKGEARLRERGPCLAPTWPAHGKAMRETVAPNGPLRLSRRHAPVVLLGETGWAATNAVTDEFAQPETASALIKGDVRSVAKCVAAAWPSKNWARENQRRGGSDDKGVSHSAIIVTRGTDGLCTPMVSAMVTSVRVSRRTPRRNGNGLSINDEPGALGNPVVQGTRTRVRLVRLPVDTRAALGPRFLDDRFD